MPALNRGRLQSECIDESWQRRSSATGSSRASGSQVLGRSGSRSQSCAWSRSRSQQRRPHCRRGPGSHGVGARHGELKDFKAAVRVDQQGGFWLCGTGPRDQGELRVRLFVAEEGGCNNWVLQADEDGQQWVQSASCGAVAFAVESLLAPKRSPAVVGEPGRVEDEWRSSVGSRQTPRYRGCAGFEGRGNSCEIRMPQQDEISTSGSRDEGGMIPRMPFVGDDCSAIGLEDTERLRSASVCSTPRVS